MSVRIDHIAIWVKDLELVKKFYEKYFKARAGDKYVNSRKKFSSYFLTFAGGARLEIMSKEGLKQSSQKPEYSFGWNHISLSAGGREEVIHLTERLRNDRYTIYSEPRVTGDGYFESVILDPEGNLIEITI